MKHYLLLLALLAAALAGCADEPEIGAAEEFSPIDLSEPAKEVAAAQNKFGLEFFSQFNAKCGYDNYVISPYSVATNLTMLANGADGNTRAEILAALGFEVSQLADANELARVLLDRLPRMDRKSTLKIANSVWTSPGINLKSDFAQTMAKYFDAQTFNTSDVSMGEKVNKWASSCTDGQITKVLRENVKYKWIIANVLYFNSTWAQKFYSDENIVFTDAYGRTSRVPGMKGNISSSVFCGKDFDVIDLYYGNRAFVMKLIVPDKGVNLNTIIEGYCNGTLEGEQKHIELNLTMPTFSVDFCDDLILAVSSMGIRDLFSESNCDISNMISTQTYVNMIRQGVKLNVHKDGSEIVAATFSGEEGVSLGVQKTDKLTVDRPFAFVIEEESTGTLLLAGKITKL